MIYNVMSVSSVQQTESHIHIYTLFKIVSHICHYRGLNRVLCAIQ